MKITLILITTFLIFASSCGHRQSNDQTLIRGELLKDTVIDIDGNVYHMVKIGTQVWMTENLKVKHYSNGEEIPNITDSAKWSNLTTGAYCDYNNDTNMAETYGRLYNWYTIQDMRGIAPMGWHVPTVAEWDALADYLGDKDSAGGKLKSWVGWNNPNEGANNITGFTALPGGSRDSCGRFKYIKEFGFWWSSTERNTWYASGRGLFSSFSDFGPSFDFKTGGWSVRCIKDK
jgi:uncharacterized protein (TIGR02145 family)